MPRSGPATTTTRGAMPSKCVTCEALQQVPLACEDCHQLLAHVQGADYFELFGVPRRYEIDLGELDAKYLAISRNIHPDKYATAEAEMQALALRTSAAVNKAYEVLRDPIHRAEYLLESAGGSAATQDKHVSPELLNEVLNLREELEEAKAAGDLAALEAIRSQVLARKAAAEAKIAELCRHLGDGEEATRKALRGQLNAVKYVNNLLAQL